MSYSGGQYVCAIQTCTVYLSKGMQCLFVEFSSNVAGSWLGMLHPRLQLFRHYPRSLQHFLYNKTSLLQSTPSAEQIWVNASKQMIFCKCPNTAWTPPRLGLWWNCDMAWPRFELESDFIVLQAANLRTGIIQRRLFLIVVAEWSNF